MGNFTEKINKYIKNKCFKITFFESISSTNTILKQMADEGAEEFTVLVANHQTAGRGRKGHSFFSPKDTGLYFSLLLKPDIEPEKALYFTTCAAVCCAEAIEEITSKKAEIKWVNDVYIENRKVCGILTEASFNSNNAKLEYVVVGIGINISTKQDDFPVDIIEKAASLYDYLSEDIHEKLLSKILDKFYSYYHSISDKSYLKNYRERSMILGKDVEIIGRDITAKAIEIDDEFGLVVMHEDGKKENLNSGDVSVLIK